MLDTVTGQTLWTQYLMVSQVDNRPWILVEGDDECHILDPHIDRHTFQSVPARGKKNVLNAMELFLANGETRAFFVVDCDFESIPVVTAQQFSQSRAYDLEAEILLQHSYISRQLVLTHCRCAGSAPLSDQEALDMVSLASRLASYAGAMRYLSKQEGLGLSMRDLSFAPIVRSLASGGVIAALRRMVSGRSHMPLATLPSIAAIRDEASRTGYRFACGHDLMSALATLIGARRNRSVNGRDFQASLHAAVTCSLLGSLSPFQPMLDWGQLVVGESPWRCELFRTPIQGFGQTLAQIS